MNDALVFNVRCDQGVYVDENHDVGRIEDVHFVPW